MRSSLSSGKGVALTFDDGPDPVYTPRILDVLRDHGARATFFCVGDAVRAHPDLVRRMLDEGHAVGSHSMSHPECRKISVRECTREFRAGRRALEAVIGARVSLFRPPHGDVDVPIALAIRLASVRPWLWTIDTDDWRPDAHADAIASVVRAAKDGDVVLLHDAMIDPVAVDPGDRSETVAALPAILQGITARGLELVPLS